MVLKRVFSLPAVAFVFTLTACAGPAPVTPAEATPPEAPAPMALASKAPTPKAQSPKASTKAGKSVGETPPPPQTRTARLAAPVDPRRIMGLTRAELSELLGKPHFRRRDIAAEIWQYRHAECILDVFLYQSGDDYRVLHFEMRQGKVEAASRARCLAALLNARVRDGAG